MRYDAVIFDLFGTLVDNYSHKLLARVLAEMAKALHAPEGEFVHLWNGETWPLRVTGSLPTIEATLKYICQRLHIKVTQEQLQAAVQIRMTYTLQTLQPRSDTVDTLKTVKSAGYKLGLISDTSADVPELWSSTPMAAVIDIPIFSCSVGMRKPDRRIYLLACEKLGVQPNRCLYVGDGGSNELTGAREIGMNPVLILTPYERSRESNRYKDRTWIGLRVSSLREIIPLLNASA
jgi:putative hydrolase of the HAD superfamily